MPLIINSPYSGKPVKVRDQDVGRAIRDEEGRIFYVLARSDGKGYYSSPTRVGGAKEEARYLEMESKTTAMAGAAREVQAPLHDATGRPRSSVRGKLVILFFVLIVLVLAWLALRYKDAWRPGPPANPVPIDRSTPPAQPQSWRHDGPGHSRVIRLVIELRPRSGTYRGQVVQHQARAGGCLDIQLAA
jgi:hypothetical protein